MLPASVTPFERVTGLQSCDEGHQCDRPEKEYRVARDPHPPECLQQRSLQEFRTAGVPVTVFDRGPGLHQSNRKQTQQAHGHQTAVHAPKGDL